MIVAFCGHAHFDRSEEHERRILAFLEEHIGDRSAEMYLGGYGEFDDFAYDCCKQYQAAHPHVSLVFVTPYLTAEYQRNRLAYRKDRYDSILYPEIEDKPPKFAITYRNRYMVERADLVVAYVRHDWGGAYAMYRYAQRKGKPIFNLADFP